MDVRPIKTEADLEWALEEVKRYFDVPPPAVSPEADRFDVLSTLIEAYEDEHYPIPLLDPVETIRGYLEMSGRTQADLAALLGSRSRASEILNRKRALRMDMAQKLTREWGITAKVLEQPTRLAAAYLSSAGRAPPLPTSPHRGGVA